MKQVVINSIKIEGFRSFLKPTVFSFHHLGLNLIKGINGAGKSTLLEALVWCLYGITLKPTVKGKIPTKKQYRGSNFNGTRTLCTITINNTDYLIARHIGYKDKTLGLTGSNELMLFESLEGEWSLHGKDLHNGDVQNHIERLLGIDSNTFLNSIVFGQKMKRLVDATPADKRQLFENIFDLDFVDAARDEAKIYNEQVTKKINDRDNELSFVAGSLTTKKDQLIRDTELLANFDNNKQNNIDKILLKISTEEAALKEEKNLLVNHKKSLEIESKKLTPDLLNTELKVNLLKDDIADLDNTQSKFLESINSFNNLINKNTFELEAIEKEIKKSEGIILEKKQKIDSEDFGYCPTCANKLKNDQIDTIKANYKKEINKEQENIKIQQQQYDLVLTDYNASKKSLELAKKQSSDNSTDIQLKLADIEKLKESLSTIITINNTVEAKKASILNTEKTIQAINKNIESLNNDIESIKAETLTNIDLPKLEIEIKDLENKELDLTSKLAKLKILSTNCNWWITKGFGSSGLKSFVFSAMLANLNQAILKYADRLGVLVQFSVDMTKASKPFLTNCFKTDGTEMLYEELSGGEQARINIATAFAIYDIISNSKVSFNILFLDEVFEGLDEEGLYESFDLLRTMAEDKSVFVMTHSQNIDILNTKTIDIKKVDGLSEIL